MPAPLQLEQDFTVHHAHHLWISKEAPEQKESHRARSCGREYSCMTAFHMALILIASSALASSSRRCNVAQEPSCDAPLYAMMAAWHSSMPWPMLLCSCRYELYSISKPATLDAYLAYPLLRYYQRRFKDSSVAVVKRELAPD